MVRTPGCLPEEIEELTESEHKGLRFRNYIFRIKLSLPKNQRSGSNIGRQLPDSGYTIIGDGSRGARNESSQMVAEAHVP
jgi:hypothetical protein